jgi:hypothetical protein
MSLANTNSGMKGTAFYPSGHSPRTRDHSRPLESEKAKPKTATEILADAYLAQHDRWKREAEANERKKAEEWQRRDEADRKKQEELRQREQVERDNKRRAAEFDSAEFQIIATFDQYGLTKSERSSVEGAITQRRLWTAPMEAVEVATVLAMEIAARRPRQIDGGKDEQA